MTTTAITKRQELTPDIWNMISNIAPFAKESRLFGVANDAQAIMIMVTGFELGLSMTASFEFVHIINNRPSLSPRGALALVLNSPEYADMKIDDQTDEKGNPTGCVVWMKRRNGLEYTARYTMEDAKRAGLIKPDSGWAKFPSNMCRFRALGFCIDIVFPDLLGGLKRADELDADVTTEGDIIQGSWKVQPQQPVSPPRLPIQDLLDKYSPDTIIAAANGLLPQTQAECDAVAAKLEAELNTVTIDAAEEVEP